MVSFYDFYEQMSCMNEFDGNKSSTIPSWFSFFSFCALISDTKFR